MSFACLSNKNSLPCVDSGCIEWPCGQFRVADQLLTRCYELDCCSFAEILLLRVFFEQYCTAVGIQKFYTQYVGNSEVLKASLSITVRRGKQQQRASRIASGSSSSSYITSILVNNNVDTVCTCPQCLLDVPVDWLRLWQGTNYGNFMANCNFPHFTGGVEKHLSREV